MTFFNFPSNYNHWIHSHCMVDSKTVRYSKSSKLHLNLPKFQGVVQNILKITSVVTIESLLKRTDNIRFNLRITTELPVSRQLLWFLIVLPSMMHPKSFLTISLISFLLKSKKMKITCLLWCVNRSVNLF